MAEQTGQYGYVFMFDKVNATASFLFIRQIFFSSRAVVDHLNEPVENAAREDIFKSLPLYYTINVKENLILHLPE